MIFVFSLGLFRFLFRSCYNGVSGYSSVSFRGYFGVVVLRI